MLRTIDYSALLNPVTKDEVRGFKVSAKGRPGYSGQSALGTVVLVVVLTFTLGMVMLSFLGGIFSAIFSDGIRSPIMMVAPLLVLAVVTVILVVGLRSALGSGSKWERWLRLTRFAAANGLLFSPSDANPQYPGSIFGAGHSRVSLDHLRSASDRFLDLGNYRYVTGSGKNQTTHNWGFMALQLDRALPHMVLDSRANNGLFGGTNLPVTFTKDQALSLEGDFDKYFTLYCPKEYERDALYVFTPDLMALLIDEASPFDVEIIDRWMFVYSATAFDMRQPALYQRLFRIVDTVGAKTLSQTDRYADERVGNFTANVVAPQGQRLKRGVSVGAIIIGAIVAVFWIGPTFLDLFGTLAGR